MRIAVVNQHLDVSVGGSELQCHLVAEGLVERGHDVVYLEVATGSGLAADEVANTGGSGRDRIPRGYRSRPVRRDATAIVAACADEGIDVVYWRFNRQLLDGVASGLADRRIPLVFAVAHIDDVTRWPVRPWGGGGPRTRLGEFRARVIERRSWRAFRTVAAVASQRQDFLGRVPVIDQAVVRNLPAVAQVPFVWPRPYVAWVGSLQARKRPELLPVLARSLADAGLDLIVAGEVRERRFGALVAPGSAPENLHHLGLLPPDEATGLIAGARVLAVTAHEEGFANVLIQAWWHGTPTVSLDHDPDRMLGTHGLGTSCAGDVPRFLAAVGALVNEQASDAEHRRDRTSGIARELFDPDRTLDALEGVLARAARGGGR